MRGRQLLVVAVVAAVIGGGVGAGVVAITRDGSDPVAPREPDADEVAVDTETEGWATLAVTRSESEDLVDIPLLWTDQARVCWDISGDLEELEVNIFGDEVSETFSTKSIGSDCRYFVPSISHAASADCATLTVIDVGDVQWAVVVQQEVGPSYGLSGINSTRQYNLLANPCTGEELEPPPGFVECADSTYSKSHSDCTWAERQYTEYHPSANPEWTCFPAAGRCEHPGGSTVPEGRQEAGSYCDRDACYLDY